MFIRSDITNVCETCKKKFYPWKTHENARFCSNVCKGIWRRKRKSYHCLICKKQFERQLCWPNPLYCSRRCKGLDWSKKNSGKNAYQWTDIPKKRHDGYLRIHRTTYHRFIIEQKRGEKLPTNIHVHHINRIRDDNRINNLLLIDNKLHGRISMKGGEPMKAMTFLQNWSPFKKGDISGVDEAMVNMLINRKIAKPYKREKTIENKDIKEAPKDKMIKTSETK